MRSIGFGAPFRLAILCSHMFVLWAWTISALTINIPVECRHDIPTDDRNVRAGSLQWIPSLRQSIHNMSTARIVERHPWNSIARAPGHSSGSAARHGKAADLNTNQPQDEPLFRMPVRFIRAYAEGDDFEEANFHHHQAPLEVRRPRVALVLVDVWNLAFADHPLIRESGLFGEYNGGTSFPARCKRITLDKIKPALEAARAARITVVHAPSARIARRYPQCQSTLTDEDNDATTDRAEIFSQGEQTGDWPPDDFVRAWNEQRLDRTRHRDWLAAYARVKQVMDIPDAVKPSDTDQVVATGGQMHRLLKQQGVQILVYCGFAANWCVMDRPGAIRDMSARGYGCILLRDATAAIEHSETVEQQLNAKAVIDQVELRFGYSAATDDFIRACGNLTLSPDRQPLQ